MQQHDKQLERQVKAINDNATLIVSAINQRIDDANKNTNKRIEDTKILTNAINTRLEDSKKSSDKQLKIILAIHLPLIVGIIGAIFAIVFRR